MSASVPSNPVREVYGLLRTGWNTANTPLGGPPRFSTGDFSSDDPNPSVIVHGRSESPYDGGDTGLAGWNRAGKPVQIQSGTVLVDCIAGTRTECDDIGPNGGAVNPKAVRDALDQEVRRIVLGSSLPEFRVLTPDTGQATEATADEADTEVSWGFQRRVRYEQRQDA